MLKKTIDAINTFPGRTCLLTFFVNVLLFGLGYGGAVSEEILAPLATLNLLVYAVGAVHFLRRFSKNIDRLGLSRSLFEIALLLGILFVGFHNSFMCYIFWDSIVETLI